MQASPNLSPARGPSTWDRMERQSKFDTLGRTLVGLGLASIAAGLLMSSASSRLFAAFPRRQADDDRVDDASADSFPASDPPSIRAASPNS